MSIQTVTLGCRLNFAESATIERHAPAGDWIVVNSCAVTSEAVRQTRQAIRRARRANGSARIIVTGCAAELEPATFEGMPEVDRVVLNRSKLDLERLFGVPQGGAALTIPSGAHARVRSFVAVQTGCDHSCTFCAIAPARGPSRCFRFEAIRDAIGAEIDRGAKEIVLTGVDITSYRDERGGLGSLIGQLLASEPRLTRLRLSSIDSVEIDEPLFELIAGEPRLLPHFHLSLQAGDDMILKRMKRRHNRADAMRTVERIRTSRADSTIGADLIAGFPTETEEMALNTLKLLDDCDIIAAHVFAFLPRPGTPAARMPQIDSAIVKARGERLRRTAAERRARWLDGLVGTDQRVLIENGGRGHTGGFAPVQIQGGERGQIRTTRIIGRDGERLIGTPE